MTEPTKIFNIQYQTTTLSHQEEKEHLPEVPSLNREIYQLDTPPYLVTTECGQQEMLNELSKYPPPENGILLGFAYEYNYNILAKRPMKRAIICDINEQMHEFYKWTANNISHYENPAEFLEAFENKLNENPSRHLYLKTPDEVIAHYRQDFMWTSNVTTYQTVRQMYGEGRITHLNLNLLEDATYFTTLGNWAKEHGYVFDVIYISNIPEWIQRSGSYKDIQQMENNLLNLLSPNTCLIDSKQERFETGEPKLRLTTNISKGHFPSFAPPKREKRKVRTNPSSFSETVTLPSVYQENQNTTTTTSSTQNSPNHFEKSLPNNSENFPNKSLKPNEKPTEPDEKKTATTQTTSPQK